MNPEAQDELIRIQNKPIDELSELEKQFLRARSSYLGRHAREKYKAIIKGKTPKPEEKQPELTPDQTNQFPPKNDNDGEDEV